MKHKKLNIKIEKGSNWTSKNIPRLADSIAMSKFWVSKNNLDIDIRRLKIVLNHET